MSSKSDSRLRSQVGLLPAQSHANAAPLSLKHPTLMRAHSCSCSAAAVCSLHRLCGHAPSPDAPTPDDGAGWSFRDAIKCARARVDISPLLLLALQRLVIALGCNRGGLLGHAEIESGMRRPQKGRKQTRVVHIELTKAKICSISSPRDGRFSARLTLVWRFSE